MKIQKVNAVLTRTLDMGFWSTQSAKDIHMCWLRCLVPEIFMVSKQSHGSTRIPCSRS